MSKAVILLSGGMDSATCLAIAADQGHECYGLSFDYGQRHETELDAARLVAKSFSVVEHRILSMDLGAIGGSALTDKNISIPVSATDRIPVTYVPARNTIFLSFALGWAEVLDADFIYIGINAVDYSGYPDCRPEYIDAFQKLANLALKRSVEGRPILIRSPLLELTKARIILRGVELGVDFAQTVSCYQADLVGQACGQCDACRLRRQGFLDAGINDPTRYQLRDPGKT
ncbi:MAG TPA: 7-cyano-7-deazaguanine synthase QueC [Gammaproteobacteria bacterium]|nr:7-cyano-7-deazaguanine synthase QueC [Gammaproteobacteria bacterium]HJP39805.1 7-cyano-7-deazaguanine synthase QueC [Gammaproteobacteria bacterium]